MLVLGVDPGSIVTGYGLVEKNNNNLDCIHFGHIRFPGKTHFFDRIHGIFQGMVELIEQYHPQQMAIENIFYAKNFQSSLKLGHARSAVIIAAVHCGIKVSEYSPLEIKKAIVGYGRASKEQVQAMVKIILNLKSIPNLDISDALAIAVCHLNWTKFGA